MDDKISLWSGLRQIFSVMSRARKRQLTLLLVLMLVGAIAEVSTLGAVVSFLSAVADPAGVSKVASTSIIARPAAIANSDGIGLIGVAVAVAVFATFAGLVRLQLAWSTQSFGHRLGHELAVEVERRILSQPYDFHLQRNTSTLVTAVLKTEALSFSVLLPLMQALVAAVLSISIIAALLYIDVFSAGVSAIVLLLVYAIVIASSRPRLNKNSAAIATALDERTKTVQESLVGIRDVIIDSTQSSYIAVFDRINSRLSHARAATAFIGSAPRFILETFGVIAITAITVAVWTRENGIAGALPILGAIALGAQRLLPLLQQVYSGWSSTAGHRSMLIHILDLLRLPVEAKPDDDVVIKPLQLREKIHVEKVSFTYPGSQKQILEDVTMDIFAGSTTAIAGKTGSGKSTLADLLMGLLQPDRGRILIDDVPLTRENRRQWHKSIAYVAQSIFLPDASIADNIVFGRHHEEIDRPRMIEAARKAQLHDFVCSLEKGYDTFVGERGIRLSGGQRQRLGLARAIYKQTPVLLLDEATSALDESTEAAVMDALHELGGEGRTIIMVAHRASTIARCDRVISL